MTTSENISSTKTGTKRKRAPKANQIDRTTSAVLSAVIELLSEVGYRDLTIDLISRRSGVARSTIYRHWSNIPELAIAAFDSALGRNPPPPDTGHIRSDLQEFYKSVIKGLKMSVWGQALPSLIEANFNDPAFKGLLPRLASERRERARTIVQRAIDNGQLKPDTNTEWLLDLISGMFYHRLLITRGRLGEKGMAEWAIDSALSQFVTQKAKASSTAA